MQPETTTDALAHSRLCARKIHALALVLVAVTACSSSENNGEGNDGVLNNNGGNSNGTTNNEGPPPNCPEDRLRCVGDVPEYCDERGWTPVECDYSCVEGVGCAIEPEPSEQCVDPDPDGWCIDGNPTWCGVDGGQYLVPKWPCGRGVCYSFLEGGFCVESVEPDSRCDAILEDPDAQQDGAITVGCTDEQTVACVDGRVILAEDCLPPNECRGGMCGTF